jgi:hypothetical protein
MLGLETVNWAAVCVGGIALWVVLFIGFRLGLYKGFANKPSISVGGESSTSRRKPVISRQLIIAGASFIVALGIDLLQNLRADPTKSITRAAAFGVLVAVVPGLLMIGKGMGVGRTKEYSLRVLTFSCATVASSLVIYLVQR